MSTVRWSPSSSCTRTRRRPGPAPAPSPSSDASRRRLSRILCNTRSSHCDIHLVFTIKANFFISFVQIIFRYLFSIRIVFFFTSLLIHFLICNQTQCFYFYLLNINMCLEKFFGLEMHYTVYKLNKKDLEYEVRTSFTSVSKPRRRPSFLATSSNNQKLNI